MTKTIVSNADPQALLRDIVGPLCERATNPHGSILSLDFGTMARRPDDEPAAVLHGWRHLTILSPWRLQDDQQIHCDWNTNGGRNGLIAPFIARLEGQRVLEATTSPPGWDLTLRWSEGLTLLVFGDSNNERDDAWFILGTDGAEAGATPIIRHR